MGVQKIKGECHAALHRYAPCVLTHHTLRGYKRPAKLRKRITRQKPRASLQVGGYRLPLLVHLYGHIFAHLMPYTQTTFPSPFMPRAVGYVDSQGRLIVKKDDVGSTRSRAGYKKSE